MNSDQRMKRNNAFPLISFIVEKYRINLFLTTYDKKSLFLIIPIILFLSVHFLYVPNIPVMVTS